MQGESESARGVRRWADDLVEYFRELGGQAHYADLYAYIEAHPRRPLGKEWQAVVRRTIEEHSSDTTIWSKRKLPDLFRSVDGLGKGHWALREMDRGSTPARQWQTMLNVGDSSISTWWKGDVEERAWLETTDRENIGIDLAAPQTDDIGHEYFGYSLVKFPRQGDIVFHYRKQAKAIVAFSFATGTIWDEEIVWAAHGTVAREAGVQPYLRPGWRHGLNGPFELFPQVRLEDLRSRGADLARIKESLTARFPGQSIYFPFALSDKRPVRPTQSYMTKFPVAIAELFEPLRAALANAADPAVREDRASPASSSVGTSYVFVNSEVRSTSREPFFIDPNVVDRASAAHASIQNALASWLKEHDYEPLSPRATDPKFDLAWQTLEKIFVAEIKSINDDNEEQQLRLGLGRVLRYRHLIGRRLGFEKVTAILAVARAPTDASWIDLCDRIGVSLVWPGTFDQIKFF